MAEQERLRLDCAARPTITVPFFADQFFGAIKLIISAWPLKPIDHKKLSAPILAAAIRRSRVDGLA
jgi:hypothetical protein